MNMPNETAEALRAYVSQLANIPQLSKTEQSQLWQQARSEDETQAQPAKKRLLQSSLLLVVNIAQRHSSSGLPILDLIQAGKLGLLTAIDTFAQGPNHDFSAHAATCIETAISKAITDAHSQ